MHWWPSQITQRHTSTRCRSWSTSTPSSCPIRPSRTLTVLRSESGCGLTAYTQARLGRLNRRLPHARPRPRYGPRPPDNLRHPLRNAACRALRRTLHRFHGRTQHRALAAVARPARAADRHRLCARLSRPRGDDRYLDRCATYVPLPGEVISHYADNGLRLVVAGPDRPDPPKSIYDPAGRVPPASAEATAKDRDGAGAVGSSVRAASAQMSSGVSDLYNRLGSALAERGCVAHSPTAMDDN